MVNIKTTIDIPRGVVEEVVEQTSEAVLIVEKPTEFTAGITGSITSLPGGAPYLVAGPDITLSTGSTGQVTITGRPVYWTSTSNKNSTTTGSIQITGGGLFTSGITGALNKLPDGSPFLVAGPNIVLSTGSNGCINITAAVSVSHTAEGSDGQIQFNSLGAVSASNNFWLVKTNGSVYASGSLTVGGGGLFYSGLTGALNVLSGGIPSIIGGTNITISTASNGQITVANTANGLFSSGLTGALNVLPSGAPFLVSTNGVTLSTGSSGQITISTNTGSLAARPVLTTLPVTAGTTTLPSTSGLAVFANAISGAIFLTLPPAQFQEGATVHVKKIDASSNYVYLSGSGSQTIDGQPTQYFNAQYTAIHVTSYNNNWWII